MIFFSHFISLQSIVSAQNFPLHKKKWFSAGDSIYVASIYLTILMDRIININWFHLGGINLSHNFYGANHDY